MNEKYNNLIKQRDKAEKRLNKLISKLANLNTTKVKKNVKHVPGV